MDSMKMNSPLPKDLAGECKRASKILNAFIDPIAAQGIDNVIPSDILSKAKGLAIFTVIKAGFLFSGRAGSGIVVARLEDGSWSAPSAIGTGGMGFGGQIGAEVTDFVVVLNNRAAVKSFASGGNVTLGGNLSVAAGPLGRTAEAGASASVKSVAAIYSYSKTKGLFAGVSIEGSVIIERKDANEKFYRQKVTAQELLSGEVTPPPQADILYRALNSKTSGQYANYRKTGNLSSEFVGQDDYHSSSNLNRSTSTASSGRYGSQESASRGMEHSSSNLARSASTAQGGYHSPPTAYGADLKSEVPAPRYSPPAVKPKPYGVAAAPASTDNNNPFQAASGHANQNIANSSGPRIPPRIPGKKPDTVMALYDFAGEQATDLPFKKGDMITVVKKTESTNDWWTGRCNGREGSFPANYVRSS